MTRWHIDWPALGVSDALVLGAATWIAGIPGAAYAGFLIIPVHNIGTYAGAFVYLALTCIVIVYIDLTH